MKDLFNREVDYLRISVTDLCNLRCVYCMPEKGVQKLSHSEIISPERIKEIVEASAKLGIKKIRLTGGEPLVRKGVVDIVKMIRSVPQIEEICMTTNGITLADIAQDLYDAGLDRLNISLDTLDKEKFARITRNGDLEKVLAGIKKAQEVGFRNIKINCVLIGGFNDDEIEGFEQFASKNKLAVRFIELMPIGESEKMERKSFISNDLILSKLHDLKKISDDGVCSYYQINGHDGIVGLISPLSHKFCSTCSRIRLTSDGKIKPCLHSKAEFDTSNLHKEELVELIRKSIIAKPKQHSLNEDGKSSSLRPMDKIGG